MIVLWNTSILTIISIEIKYMYIKTPAPFIT